MPLRLVGLLCMLAITCGGLVGCVTAFGGDKSKPFRRGEQKEPAVDADDEEDKDVSNWQKETGQMRGESKRKPGRDGWLDDMIWSSQSKDIARSLNAEL